VPWVLGPVSFASVQTAHGVAMPSFARRAGIAFLYTLIDPLSYAVPGTHIWIYLFSIEVLKRAWAIAQRKLNHRKSYQSGFDADSLARACENNAVTKYAVVIHEEPQGGYWAEVPALPGCYSQGDSVDDLMANVREAFSGVLAVMCEAGTQPESNIQILDIAV